MNFGQTCVLRSWDAKNPKEIDIIVGKKDLKKLRRFGKVFRFYDTYHLFSPEDGGIVDIHIHVDRLSWNYVPYLKWDGKCRKLGRHRVPEEAWYIAELLLHGIVDSKGFKEEYVKDIEKFREWGKLEKIIAENLGDGLAGKIVGFTKEKKYRELLKLRWNVVVAGALRNPWTIPRAAWAIIDKKLFSRLRPRRGPLFVFVGPDGAGKSTLVDETRKWLEGLGLHVKVVGMGIYHRRALPLRLAGKRPGRVKAPEALKNLARWVDMWTRYMGVEWYRMHGKVVLADRYFYGLAFQSSGLSGKFLARVSPKPSNAFLIHAAPNTLAKRKGEQSIEELEAQLDSMTGMADEFGLIAINNKKVDKSMKAVKGIILKNEDFLKLFAPRP
jgi:thymidylate kinase